MPLGVTVYMLVCTGILQIRGKLKSRTGHWSVRDFNFLGFLHTRFAEKGYKQQLVLLKLKTVYKLDMQVIKVILGLI